MAASTIYKGLPEGVYQVKVSQMIDPASFYVIDPPGPSSGRSQVQAMEKTLSRLYQGAKRSVLSTDVCDRPGINPPGRGEPPDHILCRHFSNGNPITHASSMASNSQQPCVLLTHKHADLDSHQSKGPLAAPYSLVNRMKLYELYATLSRKATQHS
uniref:(California timema) hypothetical protein n=1 Tax=Timema californicum TaxID=61474 RepID=A0A7R9JE30_TIMCA|nr:unnamed protein product [Timema californicum]